MLTSILPKTASTDAEGLPKFIKVKRSAEDAPLKGILCDSSGEHTYYHNIAELERSSKLKDEPATKLPFEDLLKSIEVFSTIIVGLI